jgi:large subunit ribosomal protein L31
MPSKLPIDLPIPRAYHSGPPDGNRWITKDLPMKSDTHPTYYPSCKVYYNGEVVMTVGATVPELKVDVWSGSHPFFTGKSAFVDAAGRVEKFQKKFAGNYFQKKK